MNYIYSKLASKSHTRRQTDRHTTYVHVATTERGCDHDADRLLPASQLTNNPTHWLSYEERVSVRGLAKLACTGSRVYVSLPNETISVYKHNESVTNKSQHMQVTRH